MPFRFSNPLKKKKIQPNTCSAVVVAAGSSIRMGTDKLMLELEGIPVLVRTLQVLQQTTCIDEIVVVTRSEKIVEVSKLCHEHGIEKISKIVRGGVTRTESVLAGLMEVRPDAAYVAIHDGARPLVTSMVITRTLAGAVKYHAAAPAIPVKDTVKIVDAQSIVGRTIDRSTLRAVQTPQIFEIDLIKGALINAIKKNRTITDDCSAVELLRIPVYLTEGDEENIKITTPLDIYLAEAILARREQKA